MNTVQGFVNSESSLLSNSYPLLNSTIDSFHRNHQKDPNSDETLEVSKSESTSHQEKQVRLLIGNKRGRKYKNLKQCIKCSVEDCDVLVETVSEMNNHMTVHHVNVIHCSDCALVFDKETNYLRHKKNHSPCYRNYICPYPGCGKRFTASYNQKIHYRIHTGERPFKCDKCDNDYYDRANYKYHMRTAHMFLNSKERSCQHEGCEYEFKTRKQKSTHHDKFDEECLSEKMILVRLVSFYSKSIEELIALTNSKEQIEKSPQFKQTTAQKSLTEKLIANKEQYEASCGLK